MLVSCNLVYNDYFLVIVSKYQGIRLYGRCNSRIDIEREDYGKLLNEICDDYGFVAVYDLPSHNQESLEDLFNPNDRKLIWIKPS